MNKTLKKLFKAPLHLCFSIDGKSMSVIDLQELGYSYIKEGADFEVQIGEFLLDWIDDSPTLMVQTSGSTGVPKSIELKKEHMVNSAIATGKYFNLSAKDSAILCLPASYIAGKMMLVRAMVLGLNMYIVPPTSKPLDTTNRTFDFGAMVPLQAKSSIANLHQIKTLLIGGAPISNSLRDELKSVGNHSFETYGMTETITHIAIKPLNQILSSIVATDLGFKTLPGVKISKDNRGCLVINALKITNDTVITNDVIELVSNNEFIWLGRYDNVINSGGIKLNPEQIESKLSKVLHQSFFISSLPDPKLGEQVVLVVEGMLDKENILQHIITSNTLNKYELPRLIKTIPEFLRTTSGKVKRKETLILLNS